MQQKRLLEADRKLKKDDLLVITGGGGFIVGWQNISAAKASHGFAL